MKKSEKLPFSIVFIIEKFHPFVGGTETQTFSLAENLSRRGARVLVLTRRIKKELSQEEYYKQGFKVERLGIPGNTRLANYLAGLLLAFFLLKNHRQYNLIFVNGGLANIFGSTGILLGKTLSKKVIARVATPGELFFSGPFALTARKIIHPLMKFRLFIAGKADFYIAQTEQIKKELISLKISAKKIIKIPDGVETDCFIPPSSYEEKNLIRKKILLPLGKVIVIFCGRLVRRKGLIVLLKAWKKINTKDLKTVLVILGSGKNNFDSVEDQLKRYLREREVKSVLLLGEKQKNEVVKYLKAADIFVYPSLHSEGISLSILEAMAAGLPVIATRVGGIAEIVINKKNGILVEKENPEELFVALESLIRNPRLRSEFSIVSRKMIIQNYAASKIMDLYYHFLLPLQQAERV
ncbi:MAG TPA: glycosyltransferase family 4 protein [Candidatus Bathyarchaeia archaeon]|nr:glycosyltransferase family 4 protein [Candidatus Bathyarchaeia archaeon]